jgi:hypothetical protein
LDKIFTSSNKSFWRRIYKARVGHGEIFRLILDSFDSSFSLYPTPRNHWKRGVTPLQYVATYGVENNLRILLERDDMDLNYFGSNGLNFVHAAILDFDKLSKPLVEY